MKWVWSQSLFLTWNEPETTSKAPINLVDEVTQFELCFSVEKINEQFLLAPLAEAIAKIPFKIRGFHSDNGSEYINRQIAALLEKLNIEFTKSRSRQLQHAK